MYDCVFNEIRRGMIKIKSNIDSHLSRYKSIFVVEQQGSKHL